MSAPDLSATRALVDAGVMPLAEYIAATERAREDYEKQQAIVSRLRAFAADTHRFCKRPMLRVVARNG